MQELLEDLDLRQAIEQCRPDLADRMIQITASIGVASRETGAQNMQSIQQRADAAMYEAKKAGRNRVSTLEMLPQA